MPTAKIESRKALPKMASVQQQWVRCGKDGCRCQAGLLHGPYTYLFRRTGGRLTKSYVRLDEAGTVREQCERERRERADRRRQRDIAMAQLRDLASKLRETRYG